ncbi:MAG: uncharacterized protein QOE28_1732 [Solirubrobacteraceae bacterium]|nr:uncharacterized protein [Solirubrobacteraceae bacterium]
MIASALYEGTVRHRRFKEREHAFRHRVSMAFLDLDELPQLLGGRLVSRRPGLVRFRRSDHLGPAGQPLAETIRAVVREQTGGAPDGPVRVLCHLRTFGHCFNPVSFFYLYDRAEVLQAVVAEVTNTPWGERHAYVLPRGDAQRVLAGGMEKAMHVSPFMGMDQRYEWHASEPGERLSVNIESREHAERVFDATLNLERVPLTRRSLARSTARYPAATLRVLALIYSHALVLKLKGVTYHPRPEGIA